MILSLTEENYIKIIYTLIAHNEEKGASTNDIAELSQTKPSSVTDMLKKLSEKQLISYEKYKSVSLTAEGSLQALRIIRKHRLWEVFLHETLQFSWDKVHEVAEQLEHIQSTELIEKLDAFLGFPGFDPHGDPIPNAKGDFRVQKKIFLAKVKAGKTCKIVAVKDSSSTFLQYLQKLNIGIGTRIKVLEKMDFDESILIQTPDQQITVSKKFADNLYVN